ncbi:hypothetical protein E2542_SST10007 [Spatholobus suberectus]|nr:hypothetical protein E2542_SST10007 [Spatholobus suberectus]
MANSKNHRNGQGEPHRRGMLAQKSSSFYGHSSAAMSGAQIRRPRTVPDLLSRNHAAESAAEVVPRQPPKLLLKVTTMGSLGPVQVVMTPESTVGDLVAAAVRQYVKEGRRPILPSNDPSHFDLHYSQFSLESLDREEKLRDIGSRNFFLCPRKCGSGDGSATTPFGSCSREADQASKRGGGGAFGWLSERITLAKICGSSATAILRTASRVLSGVATPLPPTATPRTPSRALVGIAKHRAVFREPPQLCYQCSGRSRPSSHPSDTTFHSIVVNHCCTSMVPRRGCDAKFRLIRWCHNSFSLPGIGSSFGKLNGGYRRGLPPFFEARTR